ncbi:MAG: M48 family metalloprotease [Bacteroidia bacterium]
MKLRQLSFIICSLFLLSSCGQKLIDYVPLEIDKTLGEQADNQFSTGQVGVLLSESEYPEAYEHLNKIKDRILASGKVRHKDDFEWKLRIIEDDSMLNAFCIPGGYIYVYTGIIKYLDSEDALAGVMAHEIAHADLRHGTSQMLQNLGIGFVLQSVLGIDNSSLLNLGINLIGLSFSRADESDADMNSVVYLYPTEYDARGAKIFFEKIQKDDKNPSIPEFISTHPNPENRVGRIIMKWKELGAKKGKKFEGDYAKLKNNLP